MKSSVSFVEPLLLLLVTQHFNLAFCAVFFQYFVLFTHADVVAVVGCLSALYVCVCSCLCMSALYNKNQWTYHHRTWQVDSA